ncbi:hypothetical protein [Streptomyces sp. NPDC048256]|uniref:hypothetical protein n=1 Tax=unclassified Streptomyces TaxID=2593676 RepID=UPI00340E9F1D
MALSAYRIVEAALGAGDRGPARVTLRRRRDSLRVTVSGVPLAVTGPVAERLKAGSVPGPPPSGVPPGRSPKPPGETATQLGLSPRTLHRRLRHLMDMAGVRTRMQFGAHAVRHGWSEPPAPDRT